MLVGGARETARCPITEQPAHSLNCYWEQIMARRSNGTGAITKAGYVSICERYIFKYEHVHIAEKALGKAIPKGSVVHHVDENPANNAAENLVICQDAKGDYAEFDTKPRRM